MSKKVVSLRGEEPSAGQPVADVVRVLTRLLEQAQKGEIVAIACGFVVKDGHPHVAMGTDHAGAEGTSSDLFLAITAAQRRVLHLILPDNGNYR